MEEREGGRMEERGSGGMEESGSGGMEDTEGGTRGGDADVREEKGGTTDGAYGLHATHVRNNAHCIHTYINTHVCMYVCMTAEERRRQSGMRGLMKGVGGDEREGCTGGRGWQRWTGNTEGDSGVHTNSLQVSLFQTYVPPITARGLGTLCS